ncbi:serine carboxypeptidase [Auricularia subglabra TFB-10046 SS5]|nr:serine carboxypeptidase [Auricularia subglabra TFB-10046 SS5]
MPSPWLRDVHNALSALAPNAILAHMAADWIGRKVRIEDNAQLAFSANGQPRSLVRAWREDGCEFTQRGINIYERTVNGNGQLKGYQLRVTRSTVSAPICDPDVKQHSGYLDVNDDRHLFFEARNKPESAPLVLWLNGGPGCSSSTGLFMELGPCHITEGGLNTTRNEYSWNTNLNIIFLDQPVDTGYSYRTGGTEVATAPAAALDGYAFLQLFLARFPQYKELPFHIAGESFGGRFVPNIAIAIHKRNRDGSTSLPKINLKSIALGNGMTDPRTQFSAVPEFACEGPYALWDRNSAECAGLRNTATTCARLVEACYTTNSRLACIPAGHYCLTQMSRAFDKLGLNPYDVRRPCDREGHGNMCYPELGWIETFLNQPDTKRAVGAKQDITFKSCNPEIAQNFAQQGDTMRNSAALLPDLLNAGVRVLVYAGNTDYMCNFIGNERWMERLGGHAMAAEFARAEKKLWGITGRSTPAGKVRASGGAPGGAGYFTFVEIHEAGHMAPYDQPEAALQMINKWVFDRSLSA